MLYARVIIADRQLNHLRAIWEKSLFILQIRKPQAVGHRCVHAGFPLPQHTHRTRCREADDADRDEDEAHSRKNDKDLQENS